jgi:hypothetical protein
MLLKTIISLTLAAATVARQNEVIRNTTLWAEMEAGLHLKTPQVHRQKGRIELSCWRVCLLFCGHRAVLFPLFANKLSPAPHRSRLQLERPAGRLQLGREKWHRLPLDATQPAHPDVITANHQMPSSFLISSILLAPFSVLLGTAALAGRWAAPPLSPTASTS